MTYYRIFLTGGQTIAVATETEDLASKLDVNDNDWWAFHQGAIVVRRENIYAIARVERDESGDYSLLPLPE